MPWIVVILLVLTGHWFMALILSLVILMLE